MSVSEKTAVVYQDRETKKYIRVNGQPPYGYSWVSHLAYATALKLWPTHNKFLNAERKRCKIINVKITVEAMN